MLGNIGPVGYGYERVHHVWPGAVAMHVLGSVVGGAAVGTTLGLAGALLGILGFLGPHEIAAAWLTVPCVVYSLNELQVIRLPVRWWYPCIPRQVPAKWRVTMSPRRRSFWYGVQLGAGVVTHITSGIMYVLLLGIVFMRSPWIGTTVLGMYGLARAIPVVMGDWRVRVAGNALLT